MSPTALCPVCGSTRQLGSVCRSCFPLPSPVAPSGSPPAQARVEDTITGPATGVGLGVKLDAGKPRWDLLPTTPLAEVVGVLTFGALKYSADGWHHVPEPRARYYAAALRHIVAYQRGETVDPESGHHHLAHAVCCLLFLMWFDGLKP